MKEILDKFVGQKIGIYILGTAHVDEVTLKSASDTFFFCVS